MIKNVLRGTIRTNVGQEEAESLKLIIFPPWANYLGNSRMNRKAWTPYAEQIEKAKSQSGSAKKKIIKPAIPTEDQEQAQLVAWMRKKEIRFYAVPNGGTRNLREALKFKRCGVIPGIPDLCIPSPRKPYHGLYIEMKRIKGGKPSEQQVSWIKYLRDQGYYADIAYGFEQAKEIVEHYFSHEN